jgi:hypothetical protein
MLIALIIFITSVLVGVGFWFYNKRRVTSLVDNIDDKQAIIKALANHVESISSTNVNGVINESTTVTIEKDVVSIAGNHKGKNRKSNKNGYNKNKENNQKPKPATVSEQPEKKNRPKPRRKPKPQQ